MDIEKYTSGKVYEFFEWGFKLIVWNLLTLFITGVAGGIPFIGFLIFKEGVLASIFSVLTIIFAIFAFIPNYVTIFCCIKIYKEDGFAETFKLYFDRLWDNFKALYKLELIIIGVCALFLVAIVIDYGILVQNPDHGNIFIMLTSIGYYFLMICLMIIFLCLLNLPMVVGHFRMKTVSLMRFTFKITFKKMFSTAMYLLLTIMPLLLSIFVNVLFPVWLLVGFSLPLFFSYYIARRDYWKYLQNIEEINRDEEN